MKERKIIYIQDVPLGYWEYCLKEAQRAGDKAQVKYLKHIIKQFKARSKEAK